MYVEQMLRDCEVCNRPFAVQYEFSAPRVPSSSSDRINIRVVDCPSCAHPNPLIILLYAHHVVVKPIPGPEPRDVRVRPNAVRRFWTIRSPGRPRRLTRREQMARHFMVAAIDLMRRFRPFLP
jgi:hypothetical protein